MEAGECCEVISANKTGRVTVSRPAQHNFIQYPVYTNDPDAGCCLCRDDRDDRFIVTVEGLGFSDIFSVFVDEGIELVSLTEKVVMEVLDKNSVKVQILPYCLP